MKKEIITHELLKSWNPCTDGYKKFCELFPDGADLETAIDGLVGFGRDDWAKWLFDVCRKHKMFIETVAKGYRNSGDGNSGDWNSGYRNSGHRNSGYRNSGDWNSGDGNSGYRNSGDWNSGHRNSGDWNSGDWNSGDGNSGDWNSGDWNSGYFNSKTPEDILVFNKPVKRDVWNAATKPDFISKVCLTYWVDESKMTEQEKKEDPGFYVRGGQLRRRDYKEAWKIAFENADQDDVELLKELPNFDAVVFEEITGIKLED